MGSGKSVDHKGSGLRLIPVGPGRLGKRVRLIEQRQTEAYLHITNAVVFTTELTESGALRIPADVAAPLPETGRTRIIVLTDDPGEDAEPMLSFFAKILTRTRSTIPCGDPFAEVPHFPFTSGVSSKIRPALVVFDLDQDALIISCVIRR